MTTTTTREHLACWHPRSCLVCDRLGYACGAHHVGEPGHTRCTGQAAPTAILTDHPDPIDLRATLAALTAECDRLGIPGANGDAVNYLDAVFALADGDADTPAEAIALAYGLDQ